ncbi:hypothetical protein ELE45_30110, partial [Klebsiella pneumoniae]|nr:hypothetical protein [Klebsiella pneumoniae]
SAQIREILISESAWEEMTCLFAPSLTGRLHEHQRCNHRCQDLVPLMRMGQCRSRRQTADRIDRRHRRQ